MESIERVSVIDVNKLNQEFYFQALIEEACYHNILTSIDVENIQLECIELLAYKVKRYNGMDSSSIRVETAENIMRSNLFTVSLWLKTFSNAEDAIKALKENKVFDIYKLGRKIVGVKLKAAKHIYLLCIKNKIDTANHFYNATLIGGIEGFFKVYDPDYGANEIHITADYPLCNAMGNLAGIEFIQKYLASIYYENMFCQYFSSPDIHYLLYGYDECYEDLVFNIFEQILTCAIGCVLAGISGVNINPAQAEYIRNILSDKTQTETSEIIYEAYHKLIRQLSITNSSLQKYIEKALPAIISNIYINNSMLDKVFIVSKYPENNSKAIFSFGEKMENEKYREIIEEIMQCRFISDKIAIIKRKIDSLADLEDLLLDAEFNREEITEVLKELEDIEIAALLKRHPYEPEIETDISEAEQELCLSLHDYILSLPKVKQSLIIKMSAILIIK